MTKQSDSLNRTPDELLTIPQLKLEIAKFIGEQYHPHENFDTLPHGVRADLLYFADEIVKKCHQSEAARVCITDKSEAAEAAARDAARDAWAAAEDAAEEKWQTATLLELLNR